ncbi:MAG TPA: STAS/SEC14 domain-containing protein [Geomonas sp.]
MKTSEVMNLAKFIRHKNRMLLYFDFSGLNIDDARQVCEYVKGLITRMPVKSVLTLVNVADVKYDDAFKELSTELAAHNKPYVLAGAVIGVEGWRKLIFWATTKLTGRDNLKLFAHAEVEAAKDWLVSYGVS